MGTFLCELETYSHLNTSNGPAKRNRSNHDCPRIGMAKRPITPLYLSKSSLALQWSQEATPLTALSNTKTLRPVGDLSLETTPTRTAQGILKPPLEARIGLLQTTLRVTTSQRASEAILQDALRQQETRDPT
jgi:hypothetical protein